MTQSTNHRQAALMNASASLWQANPEIGLRSAACAPCCVRSADGAKAPPTVVFMTDFGVVDDSVALCKGVMYSIAPELRIVDLTHQVTPFSILDGARFLYGATPYFPAGTVFVVVIDPGVGSTRKAVVVKSKRGQYFVLPDNGLMTLVEDRDGIEAVREITNRDWMIGAALSSTFHGRDIFRRSARTWPTARIGRASGRKCRQANWSGSIWPRPDSTSMD